MTVVSIILTVLLLGGLCFWCFCEVRSLIKVIKERRLEKKNNKEVKK